MVERKIGDVADCCLVRLGGDVPRECVMWIRAVNGIGDVNED